jgi:hypothetical protein
MPARPARPRVTITPDAGPPIADRAPAVPTPSAPADDAPSPPASAERDAAPARRGGPGSARPSGPTTRQTVDLPRDDARWLQSKARDHADAIGFAHREFSGQSILRAAVELLRTDDDLRLAVLELAERRERERWGRQ